MLIYAMDVFYRVNLIYKSKNNLVGSISIDTILIGIIDIIVLILCVFSLLLCCRALVKAHFLKLVNYFNI